MLGEGEDLRQCADQNDVRLSSFRPHMDFDVINHRLDEVHGLRVGRFVGQECLKFADLLTIKLSHVRIRFDHPVILRSDECSLEITFVGFQRAQFGANQTRVTIAFGDKGETASDAVVAIKDGILRELEKRIPEHASGRPLDEEWDTIIHATGGYLGQVKNGWPPTLAERDKALSRIGYAAVKLEAEIVAANFHVTNFLHKAMHQRGANLYELRKHLEAITDPMPMVEQVRQPKGRPDSYLEDLIRELVQVWTDATGKMPGKTGTEHYKVGRR